MRFPRSFFVLLFLPSLATAQPGQTYVLEDLGDFGGTNGTAHAINDQGWVAGGAEDTNNYRQPFVSIGGELIQYPQASSEIVSGDAWDVTSQGWAVGSSYNLSTGRQIATLWTTEASLVIGTLPGHVESYGHAMNDSAIFVGASYSPSFTSEAIVGIGTTVLSLGNPLGGQGSVAWDINESNQIVGYSTTPTSGAHAVLWNIGSGVVDLGTLGGNNSGARGINDAGDVVGSADVESGDGHAFLNVPDGHATNGRRMIDLGVLEGGAIAEGLDVNASRQVVGWGHIQTERGPMFVGTYWDEETGLIDLNDATENLGNRLIVHAEGINDSGEIVGHMWDFDIGNYRGFILRPANP